MEHLDDKKKREIRSYFEVKTIQLKDGTSLPAIGQGTWHVGDTPKEKEQEINALKLGVELGMTVIDTAEMYGNGKSERVVGEAIKGIRDKVFLVSKVYPHNAGGQKLQQACEESLKRLGTDYLDLYLLHWRGSVPLEETVRGMEKLKEEGKILRWGVSNFDTDDMEELLQVPGGDQCAVNQVLYHLGSRGIEYDLLPWQREHQLPIMAYSPLAQGGSLRTQLLKHPTIQEVADAHQVSPMQVLLAWCVRTKNVLAIPKASKEEHVLDNAVAASIVFSTEELQKLDNAFPAPDRKVPLDII